MAGGSITVQDRRKLRAAVWAVLLGAVLALSGIFGFGGLTGAGDYFSEDPATSDAARADYYWQIWGILLPLAIAIVITGVALFLFAGPFQHLAQGWARTVVVVFRRAIVPLSVLASAPYWFGPEWDVPGWVEAVGGVGGVASYLFAVGLGVAMMTTSVPKWTGVAMILGALLALVSFLPLFVFVGTFAASLGLLRWSRGFDGVPAEALA